MTKIRLVILLITFLVVGIGGYFVSLIARGYRFDIDKLKFFPNGILVAKSDPDGASIYINGDLKGATNSNIKLSPLTYDVEIKKEGYISWNKRLTISKEEVTQVTAHLFKTAPSLSPITFDGAKNPIVSNDFDKIAYTNDQDLFVMSVTSLPIGFPNGPKKIADGLTVEATYTFSPDGQQILLETSQGVYLLDTNTFTPQTQRVNISNKKIETLKAWTLEKQKKNEAKLKDLPLEVAELLKTKVENFYFSPDGNMIMYTSKSDYNLPQNLIPRLPGSSTQKEERDIKLGRTYIYDVKEDKNFVISDTKSNFYWLPTSRHVIESVAGKVVILDYDGTNRQTVFSGNYIAPHAYPYVNSSKLLILTNLGSDSQTPNLYSLSIK